MVSSHVQKLKRDVGSTRKATENLLIELKALERKLLTVQDDNQLLNMDLQQKMQKQSQILQTMSNLMKHMRDTQNSVIRNMR